MVGPEEGEGMVSKAKTTEHPIQHPPDEMQLRGLLLKGKLREEVAEWFNASKYLGARR
jgi:hypothetical protein